MEAHSRPASFDDPKTLVPALNLTGANYLLIDGYALFVHGYHRVTTDIVLYRTPLRTIDPQVLLLTKQTMRGKDLADQIVLERAHSALRTEPYKT